MFGPQFQHYAIIFVRYFFGGFNLMSGLNYYVRFWPWPTLPPSPSATYIDVTITLGLFDVAKIIEMIAGLMLICNIGVPIALILLFPVTVTVFILNAFHSPLPHIMASGTRNMIFHLILFAAYSGYFLPLLKIRANPSPIWRNFPYIKKYF
ncbi:hypothetical protein CW354_11205 [Marinicaulis flavus]|uniref:DoxX family protein n=1 Tax=Hyphococcus luteus TaxID=2058213 RepID=A0A2S7K587_9PROT|nr:hypothetical protein CW354_11205 [Marinicaulis flavus]